jgi:hypothetical protein
VRIRGWPFSGLAIALVLAGVLPGIAGSSLVTPKYLSTATLQIMAVGGNGARPQRGDARLSELVQEATNSVISRSSVISMFLQDRALHLYADRIGVSPTADIIAEAKRNIAVRRIPPPANSGPYLYSVSFQY